MSNVSKIRTRLKMIQAVCDLMDEGVSVSEISMNSGSCVARFK
jgi:hypothetical protein